MQCSAIAKRMFIRRSESLEKNLSLNSPCSVRGQGFFIDGFYLRLIYVMTGQANE